MVKGTRGWDVMGWRRIQYNILEREGEWGKNENLIKRRESSVSGESNELEVIMGRKWGFFAGGLTRKK